MKSIYFITPTLLSYIDLMSMGGSDKAGDSTRLGKYNSGLKYSIALAKRNNIDFSIRVFDTVYSENFDRRRDTMYSIDTYIETCEQTGKEKELIKINKNVSLESFFSVHCEDLGGGELEETPILTGYSVKMGVDWELWMLMREIFSNMLDEGGSYVEDAPPVIKYGTIIRLSFDEDSEFANIWKNRHLYINEKEPLYKLSESIEILENPENYLRIYKQNILVYSDETIPSRFAYNVKKAIIDEKRILSNVWTVENEISYAIKNTQNEDYLRAIITKDFKPESKEFLSSISSYGTSSDLIHNIATEVYEQFGEVKSYPWILDSIKKRKDCKVVGRKITTIEDSIYTKSTTVTLETQPVDFSTPETVVVDEQVCVDPFAFEVSKYYNFVLDVPVKKAKLKGSKVVADKFNKCLIIDENFDVQADFYDFIVNYIDLTVPTGNVVDNLAKYICKLLEK